MKITIFNLHFLSQPVLLFSLSLLVGITFYISLMGETTLSLTHNGPLVVSDSNAFHCVIIQMLLLVLAPFQCMLSEVSKYTSIHIPPHPL